MTEPEDLLLVEEVALLSRILLSFGIKPELSCSELSSRTVPNWLDETVLVRLEPGPSLCERLALLFRCGRSSSISSHAGDVGLDDCLVFSSGRCFVFLGRRPAGVALSLNVTFVGELLELEG